MKSKSLRNSAIALIAIIVGIGIWNLKIKGTENVVPSTDTIQQQPDTHRKIAELTQDVVVVHYLKKHHELPDYYLTKKEARQKGWIPAKGNLCKVLPGKAIGGDYFGNREGHLPEQSNRRYYEADINYHCGRRNAQRVVFSNDGLIFVTKDHYQTFKREQ